MKRAILLLSLSLALIARPAHAGGVLVLCDSLMQASIEGKLKSNMAPFFDLLSRSMRPGKKLTFDSVGGNSAAAGNGYLANSQTWSAADLALISPTAAAPRYDYDLIIIVGTTDNEFVINSANRPLPQLTFAVNRPKVPVLYITAANNLLAGSGDDSLGVVQVGINLSGSSPMVTSPAGFAFPAATYFAKIASTAAGAYVTPVLTLACYNYSKADPDGVGGVFSNPACDSVSAWFYNPPIRSSLVGIANTAGYGVLIWESYASNSGTSNYPSGNLAPVAVGMAARLAPTVFKFPAQQVAVEVDDGTKRFAGAGVKCVQCNLPQVQDALAGLDSMGVWRIPYTYGIEVDSMNVEESNGVTRFGNEFQAVRKYGMGRVTVHCHKGLAAGGSITDTTIASVASRIHTDIFGVAAARYSLVGPSAATRDQSTLWQLDDATKLLIDYAGDSKLVSSCVMAPTDNYRTVLASGLIKPDPTSRSSYDSLAYAMRLAGAGYKGFGGYTVVRTQYQAISANASEGGGTGGIGRGFMWPLPAMYTIAAALAPPLKPFGPARILYATSQYLGGTTTDTASAANYGQIRNALSQLLGAAVGWNRNTDMTTAQEDPGDNAATGAHRGFAKGVVWVTHVPNWRQGIGVTSNGPYSGGRPAWENVRLVHGAMEAGKWCAQQANTNTTTYFKDGPMKWVFSDQITEKDLR